MDIHPIVLTGDYVRLEPLSPAHETPLIAAEEEGELWRSTVTTVPDRDPMAA